MNVFDNLIQAIRGRFTCYWTHNTTHAHGMFIYMRDELLGGVQQLQIGDMTIDKVMYIRTNGTRVEFLNANPDGIISPEEIDEILRRTKE